MPNVVTSGRPLQSLTNRIDGPTVRIGGDRQEPRDDAGWQSAEDNAQALPERDL